MNCLDAIRQRSSCRDFSDKKVSEKDVELLLEAALASPTAVNAQSLRFALITDEDLIQKISDASYELMDEVTLERMRARKAINLFYGAPLLLVISSVPSRLTAEQLGLSSCIIGLSRSAFAEDNPKHMRQALGMEEDERFIVSVAVGYAQSRKEPHELTWEHVRRF